MTVDSRETPELTPREKRERIRQWLQKRVAVREQELPLSEGQKALWFICKFSPDNIAYNVPFGGYHAFDGLAQESSGQMGVERDQQCPVRLRKHGPCASRR